MDIASVFVGSIFFFSAEPFIPCHCVGLVSRCMCLTFKMSASKNIDLTVIQCVCSFECTETPSMLQFPYILRHCIGLFFRLATARVGFFFMLGCDRGAYKFHFFFFWCIFPLPLQTILTAILHMFRSFLLLFNFFFFVCPFGNNIFSLLFSSQLDAIRSGCCFRWTHLCVCECVNFWIANLQSYQTKPPTTYIITHSMGDECNKWPITVGMCYAAVRVRLWLQLYSFVWRIECELFVRHHV